jgi:hypothetical protein
MRSVAHIRVRKGPGKKGITLSCKLLLDGNCFATMKGIPASRENDFGLTRCKSKKPTTGQTILYALTTVSSQERFPLHFWAFAHTDVRNRSHG